jgi:hypothetical protein
MRPGALRLVGALHLRKWRSLGGDGQADIVEALQFLKCLFHHDLIFHEVCTVTDKEILLDEGLEESNNGACEKDDELS